MSEWPNSNTRAVWAAPVITMGSPTHYYGALADPTTAHRTTPVVDDDDGGVSEGGGRWPSHSYGALAEVAQGVVEYGGAAANGV